MSTVVAIDAINHETIELRELRAFAAVAQELSFSRAAERLHLTQSSVSSRIRRLEQAWGVSLFDRGPHHVALTAEGRALLVPTRVTVDHAAALHDAVDEVHGALRGDLRLGVTQAAGTAGTFSVAAAIARFSARHPGVELHLSQASGDEQVAAVRNGDIDIAYAPLGSRPLPGVAHTTVGSQPMHLACASTHPLADRSTVALSELTGERFADFPPGWGVRTASDEAFAAAALGRTIAFEVNDLGMIVDLVRNQLAVAILPQFALPAGDPVVWKPLRPLAPIFTLSLISPTMRPVSAAARAYVDLITDRT